SSWAIRSSSIDPLSCGVVGATQVAQAVLLVSAETLLIAVLSCHVLQARVNPHQIDVARLTVDDSRHPVCCNVLVTNMTRPRAYLGYVEKWQHLDEASGPAGPGCKP